MTMSGRIDTQDFLINIEMRKCKFRLEPLKHALRQLQMNKPFVHGHILQFRYKAPMMFGYQSNEYLSKINKNQK